ncbi:hypothetical protein VDGL01_04699 [Verticillium dahliae]
MVGKKGGGWKAGPEKRVETPRTDAGVGAGAGAGAVRPGSTLAGAHTGTGTFPHHAMSLNLPIFRLKLSLTNTLSNAVSASPKPSPKPSPANRCGVLPPLPPLPTNLRVSRASMRRRELVVTLPHCSRCACLGPRSPTGQVSPCLTLLLCHPPPLLHDHAISSSPPQLHVLAGACLAFLNDTTTHHTRGEGTTWATEIAQSANSLRYMYNLGPCVDIGKRRLIDSAGRLSDWLKPF